MLFRPNAALPELPSIPNTVPLVDFIFENKHGRCPLTESLDPYVCGISGSSISAVAQKQRVNQLARALQEELGWQVNQGKSLEKVVGIFALNNIDFMTVSHAILRLNGVVSPYNIEELTHQLRTSRCKALFTVAPLLPVAVPAANAAGISRDRIFIIEMTADQSLVETRLGFKTVEQLLQRGEILKELPPILWEQGQGARQTAFLCYSSGTSGLPKAVMISHRNVIANIMQLTLFDLADRLKIRPDFKDVVLGLLPQSHIFSLIIICHLSTYRGDTVVVLPKFQLESYLRTIEKFTIHTLYLVPPIIIAMINNLKTLSRFNLRSINRLWIGAAPLAPEVTSVLLSRYPSWNITLGYGMTETCVCITSQTPQDIVLGSSGWILPGFEILLLDESGNRISEYDQPGEVLVKSPSVVLGYLNNDTANLETFFEFPEGRFIKTGDVGKFQMTASGVEHLWIVDRIKELIKVKGHQVAPAELEDCLLGQPSVADCAVISVPDDRDGEIPKAFVVKNGKCSEQELQNFVQERKVSYKWLRGGIDFIESIPKSPSGKILRRLLRDRERARISAKL
ncbi:4-coumarate-CoA ligase [Coniella lustricola]|uniref:4-coumarate-CoA ligase n=1 Tax=Coniella lustricola TaxID=2025994 RepID=A0A2T3A0D2_9PEZI|nr:4-coumarate-CoA ligase [Coniella lustricola]